MALPSNYITGGSAQVNRSSRLYKHMRKILMGFRTRPTAGPVRFRVNCKIMATRLGQQGWSGSTKGLIYDMLPWGAAGTAHWPPRGVGSPRGALRYNSTLAGCWGGMVTSGGEWWKCHEVSSELPEPPSWGARAAARHSSYSISPGQWRHSRPPIWGDSC